MRATELWISVLALALVGCASTEKERKGRPLKAVYREANSSSVPGELSGQLELHATDDALGSPRPYVPVLSHPKVLGVYVLPHTNLDGEVSVQGHWVHIKLTESRWWHQSPNSRQDQPSFNLENVEGLGTPPHRPQKQKPVKKTAQQPRMEDTKTVKQ
ncbi:hypothetical protein JYT83_00230 [bacterium AH-315-F18]|nr:hypothetical protein [bacterium AH-315-F18]